MNNSVQMQRTRQFAHKRLHVLFSAEGVLYQVMVLLPFKSSEGGIQTLL